jgi:formate hydrogenlyase transcriptional activator
MRLHNLESSVRGALRPGATFAVEDIPSGWVWQHQQPLIVRDLAQETRFPWSLELLREHGVQSFCSLPLITVQRRLGALLIGRPKRGAYDPAEVAFAQLVAAHVAVAVDNALHAQEAQDLQQRLARTHDRATFAAGGEQQRRRASGPSAALPGHLGDPAACHAL